MNLPEALQIKIPSLPNIKKYFFFSTLLLIIAILLGQTYQDIRLQEKLIDTQRLHTYNQQYALVASVVNMLLVVNDQSLTARDQTVARLSQKASLLRETQQQLTELADALRFMGELDNIREKEERILSSYVDELIIQLNELMALSATGQLTNQAMATIYDGFLPTYGSYQDEIIRLVDQLTSSLQSEASEHRRAIWLIVLSILLLVIIVGIIFYWLVSRLVNNHFKLMANDSQLRQENSEALAAHAASILAEQMKMRSILDSTVDAIITITADGKIDSFNKAAENMFGYPAEFTIGKNVNMLMPEPYRSEHDGYIKNYLETGEQKIIGKGREVFAQRVDGSQFPIYLSVSEVPLSNPKLFTGIVSDITQWRKAQDKLQQTMTELTEKQELLEQEEKIARHVFETITATNNDTIAELASWCQPMKSFSGDLMLSSLLPDGGVRIVLCDFTGHGLPAALGAVPVSSVHKAMTAKNLSLEMEMEELNNKLKALLPAGMFCCISALELSADRTQAKVWNAGLPDMLLVDKSGAIKQRISSEHLPLGIVTYTEDEIQCEHVAIELGDCFYIYSDGLTEAENNNGEMFGQVRFEQLLNCKNNNEGRLVNIRNKVRNFINGSAASDDLSLLEIKILVTEDHNLLEL